jgi:hypothetical protein
MPSVALHTVTKSSRLMLLSQLLVFVPVNHKNTNTVCRPNVAIIQGKQTLCVETTELLKG